MTSMRNTAVLLIDCPDRKGLVAGVANLLYQYGANITHADQHQDGDLGLFLTRVEWDWNDFKLPAADFEKAFAPIAKRFQMRWRLELSSRRQRVARSARRRTACQERQQRDERLHA